MVALASWAAFSDAKTAESRALVLFLSLDQAVVSNLSTDSSTIFFTSSLYLWSEIDYKKLLKPKIRGLLFQYVDGPSVSSYGRVSGHFNSAFQLLNVCGNRFGWRELNGRRWMSSRFRCGSSRRLLSGRICSRFIKRWSGW